jgi:signal transduction histidine kinase
MASRAKTTQGKARKQPAAPRAMGKVTPAELVAQLATAREQQAATSEILRLMASSSGDVQPVLDAVALWATRLCRSPFARVIMLVDERLQVVAHHSVAGEPEIPVLPIALERTSVTGRAVLDRETIHFADLVPLLDSEFPASRGNVELLGARAVLAVPLAREGDVRGAIFLWRREPGLFAPDQVALVETFARQAAIAIENVRLFNAVKARNRELSESLEQQEATSEILRAIAGSPTDIQPVLETVVHAAARFCGAPDVLLMRVDGDVLRGAAAVGPFADVLRERSGGIERVELPLTRGSVSGRAAIDRCAIHVHDLAAESEYEYPVGRELQRRYGHRTIIAVPLLREGTTVGVIVLFRTEVNPFSRRQLELVRTFADQAVIAIENVRLFNELKARTTELTQSVGELRALGEVGQAVSSTLDLDTVLRTIVTRATQLAGADGGAIYEYDEAREKFHLRTAERYADELIDVIRDTPIRKGEGALGQLALQAEPVQIVDIAHDRTYRTRVRDVLLRLGYRSALAIPLVREDHLLGGLVVNRASTGEFAPQTIELLKTFGTQSALAIQNARLFREIEQKSRELEVASRHKSEFLANMSHELRTPLNAIIGFSEVLAERMFGEVNPKQAEYLADILESGRHLLSLINDILDLSKIEAGRMELDLGDFSLPSAIENAVTLVRERAHRRGITLELALDERVGRVRADERKVKQVLLNLLTNALKFTPEGGRISVNARVRDGVAEVCVTDTGIGISAQDQATVFEEFRQVGAMSRSVEGTGLGLAISRKFIELHGGRIRVTSEVGVGSTFAFTLPQASAG